MIDELELKEVNTVITAKLHAPSGYNGYDRLDGGDDLYFHAVIARGDELLEEEKVYTITWTDPTGSLPNLRQRLSLKADFGNLVV
ncbi:MAG: hypothetical protein IKL92_01520 [Oscillospiraceae bacterium]|nr:hypothetical protein [Oscillospiraceae bacterium]